MDGMHLPERYTATSSLSDRRQDDSEALSVRVDEGPTDWYHGVPGHGFVGTRAIRFDGTASSGAAPRVASRAPARRRRDHRRDHRVVVRDRLPLGRRAAVRGWSRCRGRRPRRRLPGFRARRRRSARLPAGTSRPGHLQGAVPAPVEPAPGRPRVARWSTCGGDRAVLGCDTRTGRDRLPRPDPARRPRRPGPNPTRRLGSHHPRHAVEQTVQPRQQHPGHRLAQRVRLLHPRDRRPHVALGVLLVRPQRRPEPHPTAGARGQPPAQPVDGRPAGRSR